MSSQAKSAKARRAIQTLALVTLLAALPAAAPAEILIDGSMDDWAGISPIGVSDGGQPHDSPLGAIRMAKLTLDNDFVYAFIAFSVARPFEPGSSQSKLVGGVWDDFSYLEIDVNSDGNWDYRTRMMKGKRYGVNNLAVLAAIGQSSAGRIRLHPEGTKDYDPLGPRAFFSPDGGSVEMRIPRIPLRLTEGQILIRALVRYRDTQRGTSGDWVTEYFPAGGRWVGLNLSPSRAYSSTADPDNPGIMTASRRLEPVMLREEVDLNLEHLAQRSPYIVPRAKGMIEIRQREQVKEDEEPIQTYVAPVVVVNPDAPQPLDSPPPVKP